MPEQRQTLAVEPCCGIIRIPPCCCCCRRCCCRHAYNTPWGGSTIRYVGDGRAFWRHIVRESTGCASEAMFECIYEYYSRGDSYFVTPGAAESIARIRAAGARLPACLPCRPACLLPCRPASWESA